jgi:hypothetical protein
MPIPWNENKEYVKYVCHASLISADCRLRLDEEEYFLSRCDEDIEEVNNRRAVLRALRKKEPSFNVKIIMPRMQKTFDEVLDTTCIDVSPHDMSLMATAGAMAFGTYKPLSAALGSGALRFLNKLLDSNQLSLTGIDMPGSTAESSYNGFILCYELLCNHLDVKILKDDEPKNLGCLLARAIPVKETMQRGLLCSILRVIIWNPEVAITLPGYHSEMLKARAEAEKQVKQSGMLAQFADKFLGALDLAAFNIHFLEDIAERLAEANAAPREAGSQALGALNWPRLKNCFASVDTIVNSDTGAPSVREKAVKLYRGLLVPSMAEITCSKRYFSPVQVKTSATKIQFDETAVKSLSVTPLSPVDLKSFIRNFDHAQPEGLLANPDESEQVARFNEKFRILKSPICCTRNSQGIVNRLARDLDLVERSEQTKISMEVIGFSEVQIRNMLKDSEMLKEEIVFLDGLMTKLLHLHAHDSQLAQDCIEQSLSNICSIYDSEVDHSLYNLTHESGQAPFCSFEMFASLLLDNSFRDRLLVYNPYLTPVAEKTAENLLAGALFSLNRAGQVARCLTNVADVLDLCKKISGAPEHRNESVIKAISLKSSSLAELLCTRRGYPTVESGESLTVSYDPRFLLFEFTANMMLRDSQIRLVKRFVQAFESGGSLCHQLIMGAGKTTVIAPLLALILGSPNRLVVQVN